METRCKNAAKRTEMKTEYKRRPMTAPTRISTSDDDAYNDKRRQVKVLISKLDTDTQQANSN